MTDLVLFEDHGAVVRLVMNSPRNFNALSSDMIAALRAAFGRVAADDSLRVVVLAGTGQAFCAGHDLKEMQEARQAPDDGRSYFEALFAECAALMQDIAALPQPVIAEVQGIATAAGCQLVASCDMAVAAEGTRFGVNGIDVGLFCSTPMVALTRAIAPRAAFEMLVTGEFITAERACDLGLVNRIAKADELTETALSLAQKVAQKLPSAVRLGKAAFRRQAGLSLADSYALAGDAMCENALLSDTAEGIAAFLEKRKPDWA